MPSQSVSKLAVADDESSPIQNGPSVVERPVLEFSGERLIPGQVDSDLWNEHVSRYSFAQQYATGRRVLDAGCGVGYGAYRLADSALSVAAIEIAPEAVAHARVHYNRPNLEFVRGCCTALPFAAGRFDVIVNFEMIEHVERWQDCLHEFRRVLAPGGVLLISTPNKAYYDESRRESGPNPFHIHEFEYGEFTSALSDFFPHVEILTQNHADGIVFQPVGRVTSGCASSEGSLPDPEAANFYLAVCRLKPGPAPRLFAFVPTAANVLREREHHIEMLTSEVRRKDEWLAQANQEKQDLLQKFRSQELELEERNRWATGLDASLNERRARVAALQGELVLAQSEAARHISRLEGEKEAMTAGYERQIREMTGDAEQMAAGYEAKIREMTGDAEQMAAGYEAKIREMELEVEAVKFTYERYERSCWLRLGRMLGVGPDRG